MQGSLITENAEVSLHAIVCHCSFVLVGLSERLDWFLL